MPSLFLRTVLFEIVLFSVLHKSIPTSVLDKSRFSIMILLQLTIMTCPASSTL
jgi:hypothetical protein